MFAVKGVYSGDRTVQLEKAAPVHEGSEVIVTFVQEPQEGRNDLAERQAAFDGFMQYAGRLSADFDYKKELAEYREERYGNSAGY